MKRNDTHYGKWIRSIQIAISLFLLTTVSCNPLFAQNYFKSLAESDKYFNQQISHFPDGDLLIGDSSLEAVRTGNGGELYFTRIDICGNVEWSRAYRRQDEYLELKDFTISENNEIFAYGSAYIGLDELIFFLKLDPRGNILNFRLFEPETVDHFTYNIDLQGDRLMAYGLILDFGTKKFGFVAMFDLGLNFLWGKKFSPFASFGEARISSDQGFICRSGNYLFKLDAVGELDWATQLEPNERNTPVSGPVEVTGGYILQATGNGFSFFYKVNQEGEMIWKSDQYPSKSFPADMILLPNGRLSVVYTAEHGDTEQLWRMLLSTDGAILQQEQWGGDITIKPGRVYQSRDQDGNQVISGNADPAALQAVDVTDFLLQSTPANTSESCFEWIPLSDTRPNQVPMNFTFLDTVILSTQMRFLNNTNIVPVPFDAPLDNACRSGPEQALMTIDTFLECGEDWMVPLPSVEFNWLDGSAEDPRTISVPGTYLARNEDCGEQITYEFTLEKPNCRCQTYLPTAFSPNEDGRNDQLEFFSDCELTTLKLTVFSRWGERLFQSQSPDHFWDGNYRGRPVPNGLYMVSATYEWLDQDGQLQSGKIQQGISLIR